MKIFTSLFLLLSLSITAQIEKDIILLDKSRNREIPVALYFPKTTKNAPLVIIGHGYNYNRPGSNKKYSFIAKTLASKRVFGSEHSTRINNR